MRPFAADLHPSRARRVLAVLFALALAGAEYAYFSGSLKVLLLATTAVCAVYAWREPPDRIWRIETDADGFAAVFIGSRAYEAELLAGSLIARSVCFLHWRIMGKTRWHCVPFDAADSESLRRLRVWARFGQPDKKARKRRLEKEGRA